jgi:hypothetical protein
MQTSLVMPEPIRYDLEAALPKFIVYWNPAQTGDGFVDVAPRFTGHARQRVERFVAGAVRGGRA